MTKNILCTDFPNESERSQGHFAIQKPSALAEVTNAKIRDKYCWWGKENQVENWHAMPIKHTSMISEGNTFPEMILLIGIINFWFDSDDYQ